MTSQKQKLLFFLTFHLKGRRAKYMCIRVNAYKLKVAFIKKNATMGRMLLMWELTNISTAWEYKSTTPM